MGTVQKLAEKLKEGLQTAFPTLRKTVINKLALAVSAMIESQTTRVEVTPGLIYRHRLTDRL